MKTGTTVRLNSGSVGAVEQQTGRGVGTQEDRADIFCFRPEDTTHPIQWVRRGDIAEVLDEPDVELIETIEPLPDTALPIGTEPSDWALDAVSDWKTSRPEVMRGP